MADDSSQTGEGARGATKVADIVRLSVPGSLGYVRVVRLTAAAVASRFGFDVEEIEDLRVAVDELTSVVIEAGSGSEITFTFSIIGDTFTIEGSAAVDHDPQLDDLTRQILSVVVDEFELDSADGTGRFRATKRSISAE